MKSNSEQIALVCIRELITINVEEETVRYITEYNLIYTMLFWILIMLTFFCRIRDNKRNYLFN